MEAEIGKILDLLAKGKIDAAEAERLINTLKQPAPPPQAPERPTADPFARLERDTKAAAHRFVLWCHRVTLAARCREQAQRQSRATLSVDERLRHVLTEHLLAEPETVTPETPLATIVADRSGCVAGTRLAWEVLRLGIEDEFAQCWTVADLESADTVGGLAERLAGQPAPAPAPEAAEPEPAAEEPTDTPEPDTTT